ncbi:MAG: two pore domain potassium channel family protein [Labilithrix sp.]|nr:two pore domain potassium channel family protein [Labilithrix sp.]MBX3221790.1 two pore domain potassium channel family protein [Labilithrix sp.]
MQKRPLLVLAALAAASEPDFGREAIARLKSGVREKYAEDPMGSTVTTVLVASWLFYRAERGHNPKVRTFYDALLYVSTNLSVGYSDIFAKTPEGKTIGSALMTFGPAMAAGVLGEPGAAKKSDADAEAVVERLDRILAVLEQRAAG